MQVEIGISLEMNEYKNGNSTCLMGSIVNGRSSCTVASKTIYDRG